MKVAISRHVAARLNDNRERYSREFQDRGRVSARHFVVDNLLDEDIALKLSQSFPDCSTMRLWSNYKERKYTFKALDALDPIVADVTFALQSAEVIEAVSAITGFKGLEGDPSLYAGGISSMTQGQFLNPHIDNSHDSDRKRYRMLNLLYYISPGWASANGGNLELWDSSVRESLEVTSIFNRLVVMETHRNSWHSVSPVLVDGRRNCVSNYYFSPQSPSDKEYFDVTSFSARPDEYWKRALATAENKVRTLVRKIIKGGAGRKDLYDAPND